jgi:plastocyanin
MTRLRIALVAALATLVAAMSAQAMSTVKLTGTVGPGFTITLTKGGKKVTTLVHGKYTFVISDKSPIHNFHLTGPGVKKTTTVGGTGTSTWTLTLKTGTYKIVCDPHAAVMKGSFKVT